MARLIHKIAARAGFVAKTELEETRTSLLEVRDEIKAIKQAKRRSFDAAQISRLTASMPRESWAADVDIYKSLRILRARSRALSYNNDYAKKFLQMCTTHVVGPNGFSLRAKAEHPDGTIDAVDTKAIEDAFWEWSKLGVCEISGKYSFFDIQNMFIRAVSRDGEAMIRRIINPAANKFGYALQVLDIDRLDINYNAALNDGRLIKMGVELSPQGKPLAYHLFAKHPGENIYWTASGGRYERVPAEEIFHCYLPDRPEQTRGIPWMHSAILRLNNLGGYEEAAIIAARVGASKMGFFTSPEGDGSALADATDSTGALLSEADPGTFGVLPEGFQFQSFNPDYPAQAYGDFVKSCLRGVASGLGVAYNTLSNDLEGVNFSSIRTGVLEERDNWMVLQRWMTECFLDIVYSDWLKMSLLSGAIVTKFGKPLPAYKLDKYKNASWQGRRWQWVDPRADVEANIAAIQNGLKSRYDVISEQGKDLDEVWAELSSEELKAEQLGLDLPKPPQQAQQVLAEAQAQAISSGSKSTENTHTIRVGIGATLQYTITYRDADGQPINLAGYSAKLVTKSVKKRHNLSLSSEGGEITLGSDGKIKIELSPQATRQLPKGDAEYELFVTSPNGVVRKIMHGSMMFD